MKKLIVIVSFLALGTFAGYETVQNLNNSNDCAFWHQQTENFIDRSVDFQTKFEMLRDSITSANKQ